MFGSLSVMGRLAACHVSYGSTKALPVNLRASIKEADRARWMDRQILLVILSGEDKLWLAEFSSFLHGTGWHILWSRSWRGVSGVQLPQR
jgi:hypothetical protein